MLRKFYRFAVDEGFFWPLVAGLSVVPALFVHQPRMTRKREAENRALANRAARHAVELGRARYHLSWVMRSRDPGHHKDFARDHLERARKIRTTVGPVIDEILVEVPF